MAGGALRGRNKHFSELVSKEYRIVKLANGSYSIHSLAEEETFHPVVGPAVEAEALYVKQLGVVERFHAHRGEFVVWDVGLGAAANPLTFLNALGNAVGHVHLVSFDHKREPLEFALQNRAYLPYMAGYEEALITLLKEGRSGFQRGDVRVDWKMHVGDFPTLVATPTAGEWPKPHVVMFDAFSPARNPAMWTLPVFTNVFRLLDPVRPCALPTYSRSTLLRVTLLLAGFFVGVGHATGEKEETTVAANALELVKEPLDSRWLQRVRRSSSAEPLREPIYRQSPLSKESWNHLMAHPQFAK